jgi:hypothetical protein
MWWAYFGSVRSIAHLVSCGVPEKSTASIFMVTTPTSGWNTPQWVENQKAKTIWTEPSVITNHTGKVGKTQHSGAFALPLLQWKSGMVYSEYVPVALVIQHAKLMRNTVLSSVVCPSVPYFFTLTNKRRDFRRRKVIERKYLFWFYLRQLSAKFLILRKIQRDVFINIRRSSCKVPVILVRFLIKFEFSQQIFEKYSYTKFHENSSDGSRVVPRVRTDIQTRQTWWR